MDGLPQPDSILVNGTELTYIEQGHGDPIIFVHGTIGDYRAWAEMLAPFAKRYRAITYSRRAHYPNAWPADYARCLPTVHAADLAALINALELGSAHLFGHSYGALVSLVLASQRPDLVRTLILGEPPLLSWLDTTLEDRALVAAIETDERKPARHAFQEGNLEAGVRVFLDSVIGEGTFERLSSAERAQVMDNAAELRVELETPLETLVSTMSRDDVQRVHAPTLLLNGELSPPMFHRITDELSRCLPAVERATILGVSHDLWNPPVFTETVLGFLAKH
jgi:non-heme chloroperoxidase